MQDHELVGAVLVAGLVVFLVGAGGWRQAFQQPLPEALPAIHAQARRWTWIHRWMIPGVIVTTAGLFGLVAVVGDALAVVLSLLAAAVYALGAVCWIASLTFRLTVVPWAAGATVERGEIPDGFAAFDGWSGELYSVHMLTAYVAFAVLGAAVLADGTLPGWAGWVGIGGGLGFAAGFLATRRAGPFNPPAWAHLYTALLGVLLLVS